MEWKELSVEKDMSHFFCVIGDIRIRVFNYGAGGRWYLTAVPFFFERELVSKELEDAKREAVFMMRETLQGMLDKLVGK